MLRLLFGFLVPWAAFVYCEGEKGRGKNINLGIKQYYKATVIKKNVVLAQKQKYRSVKQNRKSRNKPMYLRSISL